MNDLRSEIAETIKMPLFLIDLQSEYRDEVIAICYKILDYHYKGVQEEFLTDRQINRILHRVEILSIRLKDITDGSINLLSWIWINEVITKWIDLSLKYEEYEVATNLRKIINFEYA